LHRLKLAPEERETAHDLHTVIN